MWLFSSIRLSRYAWRCGQGAFKKFVDWYRWTSYISLILCNWLVPSVTAVLHNLLLGRISLLCTWGLLLYRQSSVVCLSVGRSVTILSRAKTAEPIEMALGYGLADARAKGQFWGGNVICTANAWLKQPKISLHTSTTESELWRNAEPSALQLY